MTQITGRHYVPRSSQRPVWNPLEGVVVSEEELARERHVAARLVGAAQKGGEHGGVLGVEAAMAPAVVSCYAVPFVVHFLWGFVLTLLSLAGAALYGLRRGWHWLCTEIEG